MDAMVSARVPVEVKEQVNAILKRIGSNPTELINAAYEYVLGHEALPLAQMMAPRNQTRVLSGEQIEALCARNARMLLRVPDSWSDKTFEELYTEGMEERYASLA